MTDPDVQATIDWLLEGRNPKVHTIYTQAAALLARQQERIMELEEELEA